MRFWKYIRVGLLLLSVILTFNSQSAYAAEEEYTYTVRLYAGNQGKLTKDGVEVSSKTAKISSGKDHVVVSGLKYGDTVYIRPQDAAKVTDERYHVKGVRRSGRDNSEAEAPTFHVACDRDYVVAYGVSGDMVAYTVNYVDANGTALMKSDVYYGNIGERQYVSSRYIAGYQPQALNMVKTLSSNAAENVFTFLYTPVTAPTAAAPAPGTQASGGTTGTPPAGEAPGAAAGTAGAGAQAAPGGADAAADQGVELPDGDVPVGGNVQAVPDENGPLDQPELEDLDDDEVPLANIKKEQPTVMGYMPIYIGIGAAAVLTLVGAIIYLNKRRKAATVKPDGKGQGKPTGSGK